MSSETVENYLETIYLISKRKGYARVSDISTALKVKAPTVTEMVQKLADRGLVRYERYKRDIRLTSKGEEKAKRVIERHRILKAFLQVLGVSEEVAEEDACRIEHYIHPETLERLSKFIEFVQKAPKSPKWLEHFRYFCEKGEHPPCEK
ncbi:MAG: Mn-dependent transcriptional regulator [Candidatus Bathyarchaeota archaeon B24]|nr:MAG: Mn-dependent transcriptional regulator [Candidatus Bathyarchaeota archaeon B24]